MKLWVVLPAYNEEGSIRELLESITETLVEEYVHGRPREFTVIVVNDGSTDRTLEILEDFKKQSGSQIEIIQNPKNMGLAETLKRGLLAAVQRASAQDVIVTMDADNTHPSGLVLRMLRQIREGSDVVIASRYRSGSRVMGLSFSRVILSLGAAFLFKVFFYIPGVRDYTCGFRAYRVASLKELIHRYQEGFISERGFSCMVDILLRLRKFDLVFSEVPMILRYDYKVGQSKMKVLQTIKDTLWLMLRRWFE